MKLVDLFCGGGGSSSGFHQAGFESLAAVDRERYCVNTYNANFGKVAFKNDISHLRSETILRRTNGEKPTVVTASPPCEPFTLANSTRVKDPFERLFDDPIGRLSLDAIRLIGDLEPEFFVIENVAGLLDGNGRKYLREEISRIGYKSYFHLVNADQFGVPSQRLRVIISNFQIQEPKLKSQTVLEAIETLPPPNYPHEFDDHVTLPISENYEKKLPTVNHGEAIVLFQGAQTDMKNYIRIYPENICPVIMGKSRFIHPTEDRLLTPREHARLMGFPDNHKFVGGWEQIYDMIGEAVPPPVTFEIAKQIRKLF